MTLSFPLFAQEWVVKRTFELPEFKTVKGESISKLKVGYETYGELNADKSNVILITHYFSGSSHAAGKYGKESESGYWDSIIGPGKAVDTNKYFVISSDTLANISPADPYVVTSGPASLNPKTNKSYGMSFPFVSIRDFVNVQRMLLDSLGIKKLYAVMGPSGGSIQAMEWSAAYPDDVSRVVAVIGPGLSLPPYVIALLNLWASPITLDPAWKKGAYQKNGVFKGLVESLKLITHSSVYFDWGPSNGGELVGDQYVIEKALTDRARARAEKVDANSILYTVKAMQSFNIEDEAKNIKAEILFIPAEKDMIFPPELFEKTAKKLCGLGKKAEVYVLKGRGGHLDGISKIADAGFVISQFLSRELGRSNPCR